MNTQMARFLAFLLLILSFPLQAKPSFLVDSEWFSEHMKDDNLVILEVRYHPHRYFTVGHLPGAVQVQRFKDLGDNQASTLMRFPSRSALQSRLRHWGVNNDSVLLLYDDSRTALTSRLYFLLELYGFNMEQVKILDGGTLEWSAFEALSKTAPHPAAGNVELQEANTSLFVEWSDIYDDVVSRRDPQVVLVDARPHVMYTGEVVKHAIMAGHIPGAINIVSLDGTDAQSQTWLPDTRLAELYTSIPKDKTVYLYCHDGFRMSLAYLQLKYLHFKDVRLYNGGWSHWGNQLTLPVVEGNNPYDNDFLL